MWLIVWVYTELPLLITGGSILFYQCIALGLRINWHILQRWLFRPSLNKTVRNVVLKVAEAENHDTLQNLGKANLSKEIKNQCMCINVSICMSRFGQQQISVLGCFICSNHLTRCVRVPIAFRFCAPSVPCGQVLINYKCRCMSWSFAFSSL